MPNLTPGDGQDVLARFKRAWERRDVDAVMALFREDAEFRPDPFEPALIGAVAIREFWTRAAASCRQRGVRCRAHLGERHDGRSRAGTARSRSARPRSAVGSVGS